MLFIDVVATIPSVLLIILGKKTWAMYLMILRYIHADQLFYPFEFYFDRFSSSTTVRKQQTMIALRVLGYTLLFLHFMACIWVILGGRDEEGQSTWLFRNNMDDKDEDPYGIWVSALYWILQTIATVGYGEFSYSSLPEYWFAVFIEFAAVMFNAIVIGTLTSVSKGDLDFEELITEKMEGLLLWVKKLELCNKFIEDKECPKSISNNMYADINRFVRDAFQHDFNLIVEEFAMYQMLPPKMQTELMETLDSFKQFKLKFDHFFGSCEQGFCNEFII
jgi:hypothetical protein